MSLSVIHKGAFLRLGFFAASFLIVTGLAVFSSYTSPQTSKSIKVVSAFRTKSMSLGGQKIGPKEPEKNVLLALRIEGISLERYREADDRKTIFLRAGENQYAAGARLSSEERSFFKDGKPYKVVSPWIIITFSIHKDLLDMSLVVGDNPPIGFKPTRDILEHLKEEDL